MRLVVLVASAFLLAAALVLFAATAGRAAAADGWRTAVASWYGPGLYGNRTACGQRYTPASWGVAHKTLRCGTRLTVRYRGRVARVPVIDRGPFVRGRELDLSAAVARHLRFSGVRRVEWRIG